MTEQDNKPKRLTLKKTLESRSLTKTPATVSSTTKSNVVVEVKKSKSPLRLKDPNNLGIKNLSDSIIGTVSEKELEEFNKKFLLVQNALKEQKKQSEKSDSHTISEILAINKESKKPNEQIEVSEAKLDNNSNKANSGADLIKDDDSALKDDYKDIPENVINLAPQNAKNSFEDEEKSKNAHHKENPSLVKENILPEIDKKNKIIDLKDEEKKKISVKMAGVAQRELKKTDIFKMLDSDDDFMQRRFKNFKPKKQKTAETKQQEKIYREVIISDKITVSEIASQMSEKVSDVIKELMKLNLNISANENIDLDTAELIVSIFGHKIKKIDNIEDTLIPKIEDTEEDLVLAPPVVTVMGHVDHGKTSLLDALKSSDIASTEAGGITQHIGAYKVLVHGQKTITFIDTPGHEAFTEMRVRGANLTDIVILVIAADDGIKAQTIEAINHAKAAKVPIIVAVTKIDKNEGNLEAIKNALLKYDIVSEDFGGDTLVIPVSAIKKINLDKLTESILLLAEMNELKANRNAPASGVVLEAKIDKKQGVATSLLIKRGTLKVGDIIVAGSSFGKIRKIVSDKAIDINNATISDPVEVFGLNDAPNAGDKFDVVENEKQARVIIDYRINVQKEKEAAMMPPIDIDYLFLKASEGGQGIKELPVIIKADTKGSVEAIANNIRKLSQDEIKVKIIHQAVGAITESDLSLARACGGQDVFICGFNVRAPSNIAAMAENYKITLRYYSIIYNLLEDVKSFMSGMLSPIMREQYIGSVEVRQIFEISKIGKIAGSYVTKGVIKRGSGVRLLRDNIVIHEGKLKTLKRYKDEVKEVKEGFECGIAFENYADIKVGDNVEVFETIEEKRKL